MEMMKKLIKGTILLTLIGAMFVSCEKEDYQTMEGSQSIESVSKPKTNIHKSGENITYISESEFDDEFDSFAETFFSQNSEGLIDIEYLPQSLEYRLTTQDLGPTDPISGARVVCRGHHSNVVACLDRHKRFAIGFDHDVCEWYWIERPYAGGNGSTWEGHVDC